MKYFRFVDTVCKCTTINFKRYILGYLIAQLLSIVLVGTCLAAAINYDESISGDLTNTNSSSTYTLLGDVDVGSNTISGTISWLDGGFMDRDPFRFNVPDGLKITAVTFIFNLSSDGSTAQTHFDLNDTSSQIGGLNVGLSSASPKSAFAANLPIGVGSYYILNSSAAKSGGSSYTLNYTWQLDVVSVPIPATTVLFCSGLLGLIGFAKRKSG